MASFIINTRSELLKTRKTMAFWLTIAGSAFIPMVNLLMYLLNPNGVKERLKADPWGKYIKDSFQPAAAFLMPMYVILVISLLVQVEYRNNTWKQVYASPRSYADIFFSKFCIIHILILSCLILFNMFLVLSAWIPNIFYHNYSFFTSAVPWEKLLSLSSRLYVSVLAMAAIQYWLSLRIRNFIAPMGIGVALMIIGFMIFQWDKIIYYPYAYTGVTFFKDKTSEPMGIQGIYSFVWMGAILALSFWDTVTRREKG
jgi:hypothetical protein